jgi:hypothetical protein
MPYIPLHISALFIALVFGIAFLIIIAVQAAGRKLNLPFEETSKNNMVTIVVLLVWLLFTLIIGISGFLDDFSSRPPKILLIILPPLLFLLIIFLSKPFHELCEPLDNFWFVYPQSFRILMEFILWLLFRYRIIPVQMTFAGGNYDIIIGLTAPVVAFYCFNRKIWSPKVALAWNFIGLGMLIYIMVVALLSTPYPFRYFMNEPANTLPFHFPFVWLPAMVVPFALLLHLLSIRRLIQPLPSPKGEPVQNAIT